MSFARRFRSFAPVLAPVAFWAACGGGGGSGVGVPEDPTGVEEEALAGVPLVGQFLADCEDGLALIEAFVATSPLGGPAGDLPSARDVLDSDDPDTVPVIGGLVPVAGASEELEAVSVDEALAMIPSSGLSASLPILATAPVTCGTIPLLLSALGDPTNAPGLVPVFDEEGDPVALVLATVAGTDPEDLALPVGVDTLPEPLPQTIADLLAIVGPLLPEPTATPTGGLPGPTPTPTAGSQEFCHDDFFPCPAGQACVTLPGEEVGTCVGL